MVPFLYSCHPVLLSHEGRGESAQANCNHKASPRQLDSKLPFTVMGSGLEPEPCSTKLSGQLDIQRWGNIWTASRMKTGREIDPRVRMGKDR